MLRKEKKNYKNHNKDKNIEPYNQNFNNYVGKSEGKDQIPENHTKVAP